MTSSNGLPDWETWSQIMSEEQRRYEEYRLLYSVHSRVERLEARRIYNTFVQFAGGVVGGFAAVGAYILMTGFSDIL